MSEGGGAPFHYITITYKVVVYVPAERADTLPPILLYPYMYSVVITYMSETKLILTNNRQWSVLKYSEKNETEQRGAT